MGEAMTSEQTDWFARAFATLVSNVEKVVIGKQHTVRLALTCLLAGGHLLLEDFPGTGKTSLARAMAETVNGTHSRIQFTPDLLPGDITGVSDLRPAHEHVRVPPRVRSSRTSCSPTRSTGPGRRPRRRCSRSWKRAGSRSTAIAHAVGEPFMVIATQNPIEQAGTYRLPEAQLDRFLMKTSSDTPTTTRPSHCSPTRPRRDRSAALEPVITANGVKEMAKLADQVHADPSVLSYISQLAQESRQLRQVKLGLSVRGCLAFVRAAKTWAAADGRGYVVPDDIKELAVPIMGHRLLLDAEAEFGGVLVEDIISQLLTQVRPPTERAA